ncbi:amino acid/polyamine transporter I [Mrakia frigida]|uniref:amino acid/polyamine transporter I n=1 Tax=Mrakia frigida TaxID=29902 RepID=UPI003FCC1191
MTTLSTKSKSETEIAIEPVFSGAKTEALVNVEAVELLEDKMGIQDQLVRGYGTFAAILLGLCGTNSWTAVAGSFTLSLSTGGAPVIVWGLFIYFPFAMGTALSLGELASAFPSAAGPSHFCACLGAPSRSRFYSFLVGSFNVAGLWSGMASFLSIAAQLVLGMIVAEPSAWQITVAMLILQAVTLAISIFGRRVLPYLSTGGLIWIAGGLVVIVAIVLAKAGGVYRPYAEVFAFVNPTGWSDEIAACIGMLLAAYSYGAVDTAIHLGEDMKNPGRDVPITMIAVTIGGLVFPIFYMLPLLFAVQDLETASEAFSPLWAIYRDVGKSDAMANFLSAILLISVMSTLVTVQLATPRMTWAFARDGGFPFQEFFSEVSPTLGYPFKAQLLANFVVALLAVLYVASTTAFFSIISSSLAFVDLVFLASITLLILNRHKMDANPSSRGVFWLGKWGYLANALAIFSNAFTIIFVSFPSFIPTTAKTMNYNVVLVAGWAVFTLVWWFCGGRKRYTSPKFNLHTSLLEEQGGEELKR